MGRFFGAEGRNRPSLGEKAGWLQIGVGFIRRGGRPCPPQPKFGDAQGRTESSAPTHDLPLPYSIHLALAVFVTGSRAAGVVGPYGDRRCPLPFNRAGRCLLPGCGRFVKRPYGGNCRRLLFIRPGGHGHPPCRANWRGHAFYFTSIPCRVKQGMRPSQGWGASLSGIWARS